jgi:hypothetical protein
MKLNEIELLYKRRSFEHATRECINRLAVEITDIRISIKEMAAAFDKIADVVISLGTVNEVMRLKLDRLEDVHSEETEQ